MNAPHWLRTVVIALLPALSFGAENISSSAPAVDPAEVVQRERDLLVAARAAALRGDIPAADQLIAAPVDGRLNIARGAALGRRAVEVCGGLCNENQYALARKLAARLVPRLEAAGDATDAERVERLYWTAWLEGEILDRKTRAVELLRAAEALAPEDERIIQLQLRFVAALSFGY